MKGLSPGKLTVVYAMEGKILHIILSSEEPNAFLDRWKLSPQVDQGPNHYISHLCFEKVCHCGAKTQNPEQFLTKSWSDDNTTKQGDRKDVNKIQKTNCVKLIAR